MAQVNARQHETPLRSAILEAARGLLVRNGLKAFSLREVARSVGRSATAIYLHFDGKDGLVHALLEEGFDDLSVAMNAAAAGQDDPRRRLEALCRAYVEFGLAAPEYYELMFLMRTEGLKRYPAASYRAARRGLEPLSDCLAELVAASAGEEGEGFDVAAATLWSALHGAVSLLLSRRLDAGLDEESFKEEAIAAALLGAGLAPSGAGS